MPENGVKWIAHNEILTYEEITTIVRIGADLGINKVRITGGEPLTRAELPKLIKMLSDINGVDEISLTTNGILLKEQVLALKKAGLRRINISLGRQFIYSITATKRIDGIQTTWRRPATRRGSAAW